MTLTQVEHGFVHLFQFFFVSVFIQKRGQRFVLLRQLEEPSPPLLKGPTVTLHQQKETRVCKMEQNPWGRCSLSYKAFCFIVFMIALISKIFPSRPAPATCPRSPPPTPTAPYASAGTWTDRKMTKNRRRKSPTWSQLNIPAAGDTTHPDSSTRLCTSCSTAARSRPRPPAWGIWTTRSRAPWWTAGDRHPRTTSHQAGPALGAHRRDPSSRMVTLTRQQPHHGISLVCVSADTRRSQVETVLRDGKASIFVKSDIKILCNHDIKRDFIIRAAKNNQASCVHFAWWFQAGGHRDQAAPCPQTATWVLQ